MIFKDISTDQETIYRLKENERVVFFLYNRAGEITFELGGRGAEAHIFSFCIGKGIETTKLSITQKHLAPDTTSSALVKNVLFGASEYTYEGLIHIAKEGTKSNASLECRTLLLSPEAKSCTKPALEILADDVRCRHAATVSPLNQESYFFLETRGLSPEQAKKLLISGFLRSSLQILNTIIPSKDSEKMLSWLLQAST